MEGVLFTSMADSLAIVMLGYLAVVIYRLYPQDIRRTYPTSLILNLVGIALVGLSFLMSLLDRYVAPFFPIDSAVHAAFSAMHLYLGWPPMLAGFTVFCLGLIKLMRVIVPERVVRSEEEARMAQDVAANAVENMSQGVIAVGPTGAVMIFNNRFLEMTGVSREDAARCKTFDEFVRHSTSIPSPEYRDMIMQMARSRESSSYEVELEDGRVLDVRQSDLKTGGFIKTYTDITERKETEKALLNSKAVADSANAIMQRTLENMDQGILMVNAKREIVIYNDRLLVLLNKDSNEVAACRTFEEFFRVGDTSKENVERALHLAESGEDAYYELNTAGGGTVAVRQTPLQEGGWVRTYSDITQYKNVEAALRDAKLQAESASRIMETTLENMGQGILMVDAERRIVTYNNKMLQYFGLDRADVESCATFQELLMLGDVLDAYKEQAMELAKCTTSISYELPHPSGRILEVRQNPVNGGGWVRTYTNISARKKIEEELHKAKQEAEGSNQAKATFLATMSHEIRTPMNGVIGMVDLLSRSRLDEDQTQIVRTIRDSGHALLTILNDILDLSKIEAGKLDLELVEMSIRDTVEGAAATLGAFAARGNILLVTYVDPALKDRVLGDAVRIRQIIFNLLSNAIKFSRKGGEVLVRVNLLDHGKMNATGQSVLFTISDHGIGIPKAAQTSLFTAFMQAETTTARRYGGTGLGLSICKRLTDMMGGSIHFTSEEGEGSTFYLELDLAPAPVQAPGVGDLTGVAVLLAGRSGMQNFAAVRYLEDAGAMVTVASEPLEVPDRLAEAAARGCPVDVLVLLDAFHDEGYERLAGQWKSEGLSWPATVWSQGAEHGVDGSPDDLIRLQTNPLCYRSLIRAVALACNRGDVGHGETLDAEFMAQAGGLRSATRRAGSILVAEDNPINQDVIRRQLDLLGFQCDIAAHGVEALQLWRNKTYEALLCDCSMPGMDGFDLTHAIREEERRTSAPRMPIIAITANALQGEAQRCLAAGMDDYLPKPLKIVDLRAILAKWLPVDVSPHEHPGTAPDLSSVPQAGAVAPSEGTSLDQDEPVVDKQVLIEEFGDDEELFKDIMREFISSATGDMRELEQALAKDSVGDIANAAHRMKSGCRTVGAVQLGDIFEAMEAAGKGGDRAAIAALMPSIRSGYAAVVQFVEKL